MPIPPSEHGNATEATVSFAGGSGAGGGGGAGVVMVDGNSGGHDGLQSLSVSAIDSSGHAANLSVVANVQFEDDDVAGKALSQDVSLKLKHLQVSLRQRLGRKLRLNRFWRLVLFFVHLCVKEEGVG